MLFRSLAVWLKSMLKYSDLKSFYKLNWLCFMELMSILESYSIFSILFTLTDRTKHAWYLGFGGVLCLFAGLFWNRISQCSPRWPQTHYIDRNGLEPTEIHLLVPAQCYRLKVYPIVWDWLIFGMLVGGDTGSHISQIFLKLTRMTLNFSSYCLLKLQVFATTSNVFGAEQALSTYWDTSSAWNSGS